MTEKNETGMGEVIHIDEGRIRDHLGEMVRGTVEEALNALLDAEADRLCNAGATSGRMRVGTCGPAVTTGRWRRGRAR